MKNGKRENAMLEDELQIIRIKGKWSDSIKSYKKKIILWCLAVVKNPQGLSIVLADDDFVKNLNKKYRNKDKPTNVLSFTGSNGSMGDVILAYQTIQKEAKEQNKNFDAHLAHLITHGILHLQGFDHENDEMAEKMEIKEIEILKKLGFSNPYNIK